MSSPGGDGTRERPDSPVRPVAAIVIGALALVWMILTMLDLRENDGIAPLIAMFGVPALAAAVIIQTVMTRLRRKERVSGTVFWWVLVVLPLGTLAAFGVAILRDPDYFIGDAGPWMLIWVPIFIVVAILLGALVWFFFVFPAVMLVEVSRRILRGEAKPTAIIPSLVLLAIGVLCIVGGLSIDTDSSGRASWGAIIAAFLGLPGGYDVVWEPGLWIVRGTILTVVLVFAVPAISRRIRS